MCVSVPVCADGQEMTESDWHFPDARFLAFTVDGTSRPFDIPWMVLNSALASKIWNWQPETPLQTILEEIAKHAESHPDWLDLSAP